MSRKLILTTFVLFGVIVVSLSAPARTTPHTPYGGSNSPVVTIVRTKEMTTVMQLEAIDAFERAYAHLTNSSDRCSIVRQIFLEKYPEYKWHVAMYKAYSVQSIISVDIRVNSDSYVLFATKK